MRVLHSPERAATLFSDPLPLLDVKGWLDCINSPLADLMVPIPLDLSLASLNVGTECVQSFPVWVRHCSSAWTRDGVTVPCEWLLNQMQEEQSALYFWRKPAQVSADFRIERVPLVPPRDQWGPWHYYLDGPGAVRCLGETRLFKACGFDVPDVGHRVPHDVMKHPITGLCVLGLASQLWHAAWYADRKVRQYRAGDHVAVLDYQNNEKVECGDEFAYLTVKYTPHEENIYNRGNNVLHRFGIRTS